MLAARLDPPRHYSTNVCARSVCVLGCVCVCVCVGKQDQHVLTCRRLTEPFFDRTERERDSTKHVRVRVLFCDQQAYKCV